MFRKQAVSAQKEKKDNIKWRGHEVKRIEAFSDAVFAFAVTLLIVALEVPETYEELMESMRMFIPFAMGFALLFAIWYAQNLFFRRYGLHDVTTLVLNGVLLFMCLFFVYPVKFMFGAIFSHHHFKIDTQEQVRNLYFIYSGGFAIIYLLFALMYRNALKHADELQLTVAEVFETKTQVYSHALIGCVGLVSILVACIGGGITALAGMTYVNMAGNRFNG